MLHTIERLTNSAGVFSFVLAIDPKNYYQFNEITPYDKVKIYLGNNSVPATPTYIGRIEKISAPLTINEGYVRIFTGKSQGEKMERLQKTKYWINTPVSDIVTEIANDLGLGLKTDTPPDSTLVTLKVEDEPYLSVLQKLSDYWVDGGTQIRKDFRVDLAGDLVWKNRPFRSSGVETLIVGSNVLSYNVNRNVTATQNRISVYGAQQKNYPQDTDKYTEQNNSETPGTDGWGGGTLSWNSDSPIGNESMQATSTSTLSVDLQNTLPEVTSLNCVGWKKSSYTDFNFWVYLVSPNPDGETLLSLQLYAPDVNNRLNYYITGASIPHDSEWFKLSVPLGLDAVGWSTVSGTPDWSNIQRVRFFFSGGNSGDWLIRIDGMYFSGRYFEALAEDGSCQTGYGRRDLTVVDSNLLSDAQCQSRAETLLYQLKNLPMRIDITTSGNTNLLIGDRLTQTIPAEGITAQPYDILEVEHLFSEDGWTTTAKMINIVSGIANKRVLPSTTINEILREEHRTFQKIMQGQKIYR